MTPPSGADSTRDRILTAATAEFSRHGIAGARIDRIARAARTSKERVYAYFSGKEALYRVVSARELAAVAEATRLDPTDLPGYAGRVHDYFAAHPDRYRLMMWGQLELDPTGAPEDDPVRQSVAHKTEQLRRAQDEGHLDPAWDPLDVLVLVNQIAMAWAGRSERDGSTDRQEHERFLADRRAAAVIAVRRLFPAAAAGSR
ncbi:TetR family transcriptional regulator [Nocardiopsis sp. NPDC050513]|uniref:TetR family transcriptional regulator n=1 Tax=Nocardiopsis sp. NPDC050513 TaxID=3364338 RepID=UPI0037B12CFA